MEKGNKNVYLVGPMGSGKTTIGSRLASRLGFTFYDCDHEIEARTGASVNLIFEIEGESGFREREHRMLEELTAREGVLVATGGGAMTEESNRALLRNSGIVVYLQTPVEHQLQRLRRDKSRPLLQTEDRRSRLEEMARVRNPQYESVAHLVFPARSRSIDRAVNQIYKSILSYTQAAATGSGAPKTGQIET